MERSVSLRRRRATGGVLAALASGPQVIAVGNPEAPLPATTGYGAQLDGAEGTPTPPFLSAPDQFGRRHAFGIAWATPDDTSGGIVMRAEGPNADLLAGGNADNTDVYRLIYATLFGRNPQPPRP